MHSVDHNNIFYLKEFTLKKTHTHSQVRADGHTVFYARYIVKLQSFRLEGALEII